MAEEQRCQAPPEGHRLCANNCGFFGSPATLNLCSKCYRDHCLKEEQASSVKFAVEKSLAGGSSSSSATMSLKSPAFILPAAASVSSTDLRNSAAAPPLEPPVVATEVMSQPNRCSTCRKRVGLTGFKCKCGITFCSSHRYPEQHGCTFDFKGVGREAIAKANPIVKAEKLDKI